MHVSASSACVALVAALMVSSVSATAGKLDEYSCDDMCGGCKIKNTEVTSVNAFSARGSVALGQANAGGEASSAYCSAGSKDGSTAPAFDTSTKAPSTAGQLTFYRECAKAGAEAADDVDTDQRSIVTVDQYDTDACAGGVHRTTFVIGSCYVGTDKNYITGTDWTDSLAYKFTGTSKTDVKIVGYKTEKNCGSNNKITAEISITANCGTDATTDKRAKLPTTTLYGDGFKNNQPVVRDIYVYAVTGTTAQACTDLPTGTGFIVAGAATSASTKLSVKDSAHTATTWQAGPAAGATDGAWWVETLYPRGACFGAKGAKLMWICPSGTSTPVSSADSSADSTAAATTTAAPVVTTTAAAATTTAAASSASAVSAIAAFAAAVLCVVA